MASPNTETSYDTTSWTETPLEGHALKTTRVKTDRKFTGRLEGTGVAEYVMVYHPSDATDAHAMTASFAGLMVFKGTLDGGEPGEVTFITTGKYDKTADAQWVVDEKTATGGLKGIKGTGGYSSAGMKGTKVSLDIQK